MPELRIAELIVTIDELRHDLDAHRDLLIEADSRSRIARGVGLIGVVTAVIGLMVGGIGAYSAHENHRAVVEIVQTRAENRVTTCLQANVLTMTERSAADAHDKIVAANISPEPRSPHDEAAVKVALQQLHDQTVAGLPYRDCSPAGIAAWYEHQPRDPNA